jgi:predicted transcriptional regulator
MDRDPMRHFTLRVGDRVRNHLDAIAKAEGRPVSTVARDLLRVAAELRVVELRKIGDIAEPAPAGA